MTTPFNVDAAFDDRAVCRGGLRLFQPVDAIDLIRAYRNVGITILGLDAFFARSNDQVQPSQEDSIDFTSERFISLLPDSWHHAERFIRSREASPLLFEVVVDRTLLS